MRSKKTSYKQNILKKLPLKSMTTGLMPGAWYLSLVRDKRTISGQKKTSGRKCLVKKMVINRELWPYIAQ